MNAQQIALSKDLVASDTGSSSTKTDRGRRGGNQNYACREQGSEENVSGECGLRTHENGVLRYKI